MHLSRIKLSVLTINVALWLFGCGGHPSTLTGPDQTSAQVSATGSPGSGITPLNPGTQTSGVIAADSPTCSYTVSGSLLAGPCRRYYILGLGRGKVNVTLSWSAGDELTLAVASGTGDMVAAVAACCQSPLQMTAPLFPFDATPVAVIYTGRQGLTASRTIPFVLSAGPFVPSS